MMVNSANPIYGSVFNIPKSCITRQKSMFYTLFIIYAIHITIKFYNFAAICHRS